jgi:alpha-beta hydrolase superfamily lysophospholipase
MMRITKEAYQITLPMIIVQGGDDRLVEPSGAQMLYEKAGSTDKILKIYPELYHEVLNEPERELVLSDIESWLEAHL